MPSRGGSRALRQLRATFATAAESTTSKRARAQAHLASVDARNGASVSPALMDSFGRGHNYLRISLTERCNLRCTYCMPAEGVPLSLAENMLTNDEIVRLARLFVGQGVTKIRLTGGEPTLRKDLDNLIERLAALGSVDSIGMTSNGIALSRKLPDLVRAGLTGVNLSLDTLDPFKFELMTRRRGHSAVLNALDKALTLLPPRGTAALMGEHLAHVKLNVVVVKGVNDSEAVDFAELARDRRVDVRFIEYMPFDDNAWATQKLVPSAQLLSALREKTPLLSQQPGHASDTARAYSAPGWEGTVGFISSMTDHFCAGCSRLRLGADGGLKVCLFGPPKVNLRHFLRTGASDTELLDVIGSAVKAKKFAHDGSSSPSVRDRSKAKSADGNDWRLGSARRQRPMWPLSASKMVSYQRPRMLSTSASASSEDRGLTHFDAASGRAKMVDVGDKPVTRRSATAVGTVTVPPIALQHIVAVEKNKKGDVLATAQLAGIMAAKNASALIPLCHPVILDKVAVDLQVDQDRKAILVRATVACEGRTGVEMEALTAVSATCLTVWDMLKAVAGEEMQIGRIMVVEKTGGTRSGNWKRVV